MEEIKEKMYVSVIIPTYHDWERLKICIDALSKQTYPRENFEVIIVNNDPQDSPPELSLPDNFRISSESKPGSYAARNAGIKEAEGEILAFTDSDCIPDEKWLENGIKKLCDTGVSRIAGQVKLLYAGKKLTVAEIYEKVFAFRQNDHVKNSGSAVTANMFSKKEVFDSIELFNESALSGEDIAWGRRAHENGFKIEYCKSAIVHHPARKTLGQVFAKSKRVAGGIADNQYSSKNSLIGILKGFLFPVHALKDVFKKSNLSFYEKITAITIQYFLKIHKSLYVIKFKFSNSIKPRT